MPVRSAFYIAIGRPPLVSPASAAPMSRTYDTPCVARASVSHRTSWETKLRALGFSSLSGHKRGLIKTQSGGSCLRGDPWRSDKHTYLKLLRICDYRCTGLNRVIEGCKEARDGGIAHHMMLGGPSGKVFCIAPTADTCNVLPAVPHPPSGGRVSAVLRDLTLNNPEQGSGH